jgi:hypothetical protein
MLEEAHPTARDTLTIDNKQWVPAAELLRVLLETPAAATRDDTHSCGNMLYSCREHSHTYTHTPRDKGTPLRLRSAVNSLHVHEAQLTTLGYM